MQIKEILAEADDKKLCENVYDWIVNRYGDAIDLAEVPEHECVVLCVWNASGIIGNGGFNYLFESNFDGDPRYLLTAGAFKAIGSPDAIAAFQRAFRRFPGGKPPAEIDVRLKQYRSGDAASRHEVDRLFWKASQDLHRHLADYVRSHKEAFLRATAQVKRPLATTSEKSATPKNRRSSSRGQMTVPDRIEALPHWARVALAGRCARTVLPVFRRAWPNVLPGRLATVERCIRAAEESARQARTIANIEEEATDGFTVVGTALLVDCFNPADFADAGDLVRVGEWGRALAALNKSSKDYEPFRVAWMRGRCHAALGMWAHAEREYAEALASVPVAEGAEVHMTENTTYTVYWRADVWKELCAQPALFDRVAQHRSDDPLRWEAAAWRYILEERWREAADCYARAMHCPHDDNTVFEFALAQIAAGDVREALAGIKQRFDAVEDADQLTIEPQDDDEWRLATNLWLFSPQGAVRLPGLISWLCDEVIQEWRRSGLAPIALYRFEDYDRAVRFAPPYARHEWDLCGRFWLVKAMTHQRLGDARRARDAYSRAIRWLARRTRIARIEQDYTDAWVLLQAEALRREAERLIFK